MKFVKLIKSNIGFNQTLVVESIIPEKDEKTGEELNSIFTLFEGKDVIGKAKVYLEFKDNDDYELINIARNYFSRVDSNAEVIRK